LERFWINSGSTPHKIASYRNEPEARIARQLREREIGQTAARQEVQMSFAARLVALFGLLAAPFCAPAQASEYEIGASLICDTQGQVERFVAVFTGDAQAAIRVVNAEEKNASACAIMNVAYMRGAQVGMARHGDNAFEIIRILVVGIETGNGTRPVRPAAYFSLFGVKEYAV
jgi:hypothetical protein